MKLWTCRHRLVMNVRKHITVEYRNYLWNAWLNVRSPWCLFALSNIICKYWSGLSLQKQMPVFDTPRLRDWALLVVCPAGDAKELRSSPWYCLFSLIYLFFQLTWFLLAIAFQILTIVEAWIVSCPIWKSTTQPRVCYTMNLAVISYSC